MNKLLILISLISFGTFAQNSEALENMDREDSWDTPSFNGSDFLESPKMGNLSHLDSDSQLLQKDIFRPNLEVNTNRGSLKSNFSIELPPNLLNNKVLSFNYNHRQQFNLGYGIGWNIALPELQFSKEELEKITLSADGSYIVSECSNRYVDAKEFAIKQIKESEIVSCYKPMISGFPKEILRFNNYFVQLNNTGKHQIFNKAGKLILKFDEHKNYLKYNWKNYSLSQITNSFNDWTLNISYREKGQITSNNHYFYNPFKGVKNIEIKNREESKLIEFEYDSEYLITVKNKNSQKHLFKGAYEKVKGNEEKSDYSYKKDYSHIFKRNTLKAEQIKNTKYDSQIELLIDLNNDFRPDKIVVDLSGVNAKLKKIQEDIKYEVSGDSSSSCKARPIDKRYDIERKMRRKAFKSVKYSIHWAKVDGDRFTYEEDESLSNIRQNILDFKLVKAKKSTTACGEVHYYKPLISVRTPYVLSVRGEHNDILWCRNIPKERKDKSRYTDFLKALKNEAYIKNFESQILKIDIDRSKLSKFNINDKLQTNVLSGVRKWRIEKGPSCNGSAVQLDINNDGKPELITGNEVVYFSNSSVLRKPLKSISNSLIVNMNEFSDSEDLKITSKNGYYEFINLKEMFTLPFGTVEVSKKASTLNSSASKVKLLTSYYSHFNGRYEIDYKSSFNTQIVKNIKKIDENNFVHRETSYVYDGIMYDDIIGVFIGFSNTKEEIRSASTSAAKLIERRFLKDNNLNVFLFNSRARLQGELIYSKVSSENKGYELISKKDALSLSENRIFLYTSEKLISKFDGEIYLRRSKTSDYKLQDDIPVEEIVTFKTSSKIDNEITNEESYKVKRDYKEIEGSYVQKVKTTKETSNKSITKSFVYDHVGNLLEEESKGNKTLYQYDEYGRIVSVENQFGVLTNLLYLNNVISPIEVFSNGRHVKYSRSKLLELVLKSEENGAVTEYLRDAENQIVRIIKNGSTQFRKSNFNFYEGKVSYNIESLGQEYKVELNGFGHPIKLETTRDGRPFTVFQSNIVDTKVIKKYSSHNNIDKSDFSMSTYDGFGRVTKTTYVDSGETNTISNIYSKGCVNVFRNDIFLSKECKSPSNVVFSKNNSEENIIKWSGPNNLKAVNDEVSWFYDAYDEIFEFSFKDEILSRKVNYKENTISFKDKELKFDRFKRLKSGNIGLAEFEFNYNNGNLKLEKIENEQYSYIQTYNYVNGLLSTVNNGNYSKAITYDKYDQPVEESIETNRFVDSLKYSYANGKLSEIKPHIYKIHYDTNNNISLIEYSNGLKLKISYLAQTNLFKSLEYKNDKSLITQKYKYNELNQLIGNYTFQGKDFPNMNKKYSYNNFVISNQFDKKALADVLIKCEEYLCGMTKGLDEYSFLNHPTKGLVAGINTKGQSFKYINENEVLINNEYARLIKVNDIPLGFIKNTDFYPVITNYKKEVIGLISTDGKEVLFIRDFDFNGNKKLHLNPTKDKSSLEQLDQSLVWSFSRLRHNPLRKDHTYYWSQSRVYSTELGEWTAIDPLVAWNPKSLTSTFGNWNPYKYCGGDSVNCVDETGHFAVTTGLLVVGGVNAIAMGSAWVATKVAMWAGGTNTPQLNTQLNQGILLGTGAGFLPAGISLTAYTSFEVTNFISGLMYRPFAFSFTSAAVGNPRKFEMLINNAIDFFDNFSGHFDGPTSGTPVDSWGGAAGWGAGFLLNKGMNNSLNPVDNYENFSIGKWEF